MNIFKSNYKISAAFIALIVLSAGFLASIIVWLSSNEPNGKIASISGSLAAGLFVAIIQFIISWRDYKQTEKLSELKLIEILYRRNDSEFYAKYMKEATKEIKIMGVTATRFFNDFADNTPNADDKAKTLFSILDKGVNVKMLLPQKKYLDSNKQSDLAIVIKKVQSIKGVHRNLELRFFDHIPSHSIFSVDDTCIVGPVFPLLESKNTPALHLRNNSPIAKEYIKYFDEEWEKATE